MPRMLFGGGPEDVYLVEDAEGDLQAGGGATVLFYTAETAGTQITDLQDVGANPVTYILTSDGTDGRAPGQIPPFYGPDDVFEMWASANASPRFLLNASNLGSYLGPMRQDLEDHLASGNNNPHVTGFSNLADVDQAAWDAAAIGSTVVKGPDGTLVPAGGLTPMSDIIWVAAADAPAQFNAAPYQCDGTADDVQIQQAINNANGLRVGLSPGTFNLSAPITLYGADTTATRTSKYLIGSGVHATKLVVGSGVAAGIQFSRVVTPFISDLTLTVTGSSGGIAGLTPGTPAAQSVGSRGGALRNLMVIGPGNGTHTGWAYHFEATSQLLLENLDATGVGFGMRIGSYSAASTTRDIIVNRAHMKTTGTGQTGFRISAATGDIDRVTLNHCYAEADTAYPSGVGFQFGLATDSDNVAHIRGVNCEVYRAKTAVEVHEQTSDVQIDFGRVSMGNAETYAYINGYSSVIKAGYIEVAASAAVTLLDDNNPFTMSANVYEWDVWTNAGASVTGDPGLAVIQRGLHDGSGTMTSNLIRNPGVDRSATFVRSGTAVTGPVPGVWYNDTRKTVYVRSVRAFARVAPTGAAILVDVNRNGTTIYTTQANRPSIPIGATTGGRNTTFAIAEIPVNNYLTVDIDQIGSTVAGTDVTVQIEIA